MKVVKRNLRDFLHWSEKYTKTDMVYLARGGSWLGGGQVISSLLALALATAFGNLVPPETYGTYKYILAVAAIFALFTLPGLNVAFARAVVKNGGNLITSLTLERIKYSFIGSLIALAGSAYYMFSENITLAAALLIVALTLPVFDTLKHYRSYFVGKRRFDLSTKYHVYTQVISVSVLICTVTLTDNIVIILLAYFLPLSTMRAFFYWKTLNAIAQESKSGPHPSQKDETLKYGKHLTAINIIGVLATHIDKILLWKFFGATQLAIYTFALAIPEQIKGPLKGLGELAFPKFASQTHKQIEENLSRFWYKFLFFVLALTAISFIYIISAPIIYGFLFPQYSESVVYSQIFSLSLITAPNVLCIKLLEAQKKTKVQYILQTGRPIILIALFVILIPIFGVIGAICAMVLTRFLFMLSSVFALLLVFRKNGGNK